MESKFEDYLKSLKGRLKIIFDADPNQSDNEYSVKRYLRAFKDVDCAFQAVLKTNKWRELFDVQNISAEDPVIKKYMESKKAMVLRHRDSNERLDDVTANTVVFVNGMEELMTHIHPDILPEV